VTAAASPCPLCETPRDPDRPCPSCGLTPDFGPDRPDPFVGRALAMMLGAIGVVFALTLLVVALAA
jgi:hypothetical protein